MASPPPKAQIPILKKLKYTLKNKYLPVITETNVQTNNIIQKKVAAIKPFLYFLFLINIALIQPNKPNNNPTNKPIKNLIISLDVNLLLSLLFISYLISSFGSSLS